MSDTNYAVDPRAPAFFASYPSRKLNLGSGADIRDGYTNIDMHFYGVPNSLVGDVTNLDQLPSGNFDEIVAQDILEHIRFKETPMVLYEWNRLLRPGGRIFIRSTYLNGLLRLFEMKEHQSIGMQLTLLTNLFSRQLVDGDYHFTAFTEPMMRFYLWATSFDIETISVMDGWIFEIWAVKRHDIVAADIQAVPNDKKFLQAIYRHLLNREVDVTGLKDYGEQLVSGSLRADITKQIWTSEEYQSYLVDSSPVFDLEFHQAT